MSQDDQTSITPAALLAASRFLGSGDETDAQNMIAAMTPGGIERQEAEGQAQFVSNEQLPLEISGGREFPSCRAKGCFVGFMRDDNYEFLEDEKGNRIPCENCKGTQTTPETWAYLESLGFEFGKQIDDLFIQAKLPVGWTKERSSHSMWSYIHDEKGRERMAVFYKAAFYDRRSQASISKRFGVKSDFEAEEERGVFLHHVTDKCIDGYAFSSEPVEITDDKQYHELNDESSEQCYKWLKENYPNYENPSAYWDED